MTLALVIHRVMRWRIKEKELPFSPEYLLEKVKMVQHHQVRLATDTLLGPMRESGCPPTAGSWASLDTWGSSRRASIPAMRSAWATRRCSAWPEPGPASYKDPPQARGVGRELRCRSFINDAAEAEGVDAIGMT